MFLSACTDPVTTFGRPGLGAGEFRDPRAVAAGAGGIAVVDRSSRLQLFDLDGRFAAQFAVAPPETRRGLPCGVAWLADGTLAIADTHQSCVRIVSAARETLGATLARLGTLGAEPGSFNMPQRVAELPGGRLAVTDFGTGRCNRVQVLERDGRPVLVFGGPEPSAGGLERPMGVVPRADGSFVVADQRAGLVVFDGSGRFVGHLGGRAPEPGLLLHGLCRDDDGTLFATDLGRDRLLRVAPDGEVTGTFGRTGSAPGEFLEPWDVAAYGGRLYVADKGNHRVVRIDPSRVTWQAP